VSLNSQQASQTLLVVRRIPLGPLTVLLWGSHRSPSENWFRAVNGGSQVSVVLQELWMY